MERLPEKRGGVNPVRERYASGATSVTCGDFSLTGSTLPCVIRLRRSALGRIAQDKPKTAPLRPEISRNTRDTAQRLPATKKTADHE